MQGINREQTEDNFYCYSLRLFHFLRNNELYYKYKGVNDTTNRTYWVFIKSDKLQLVLKAFHEEKEKFLNSK